MGNVQGKTYIVEGHSKELVVSVLTSAAAEEILSNLDAYRVKTEDGVETPLDIDEKLKILKIAEERILVRHHFNAPADAGGFALPSLQGNIDSLLAKANISTMDEHVSRRDDIARYSGKGSVYYNG